MQFITAQSQVSLISSEALWGMLKHELGQAMPNAGNRSSAS
jgi:hypothetical protein